MARFGRGYAINPFVSAGAIPDLGLRGSGTAQVYAVGVSVLAGRAGASADVRVPAIPTSGDVALRIGATGDFRSPGTAVLAGRGAATADIHAPNAPLSVAGRAGATADIRSLLVQVISGRGGATADVHSPVASPISGYVAFTPTYAIGSSFSTTAVGDATSTTAVGSTFNTQAIGSTFNTSSIPFFDINAVTHPTAVTITRAGSTASTHIAGHRSLAGRAPATGGAKAMSAPYGHDSFTGAADALLTTHTAEIGGTWLRHSSSVDSVELTGDGHVRVVTGNAFSSTYYLPAAPPATYEVAADYVYATAAATIMTGVVARLSTSATTLYLFCLTAATGNWELYRIVAGTGTLLASAASTATVGATGRIKLRVSGTTPTLVECVVDQATVISYSDASPITAAGKGGVRLLNSGGSTAGVQLGNFYLGDRTVDIPPFSVVGTSIIGQSEQPFLARGMNMGVNAGIGGHVTVAGELGAPHTAEALDWNLTLNRSMIYASRDTSWIGAAPGAGTYGRQKAIDDWIAAATNYLTAMGQNFVVMFNAMDITSGNGVTANDLPDIENAITQVASHFIADPRVWFNINEPDSGTVNSAGAFQAFHGRFYDAVRNTGSNAIYVADAMTNAQDSVFGSLPKVYDPTVGPAFLANPGGAPRHNVVFALHNYGGQGQNLHSQDTFNTTYSTYIDNCRAAGLAVIIAETGFRQDGRDFAGGRTDTNRNVRGFYASLNVAAAKGLGVVPWHGTYDVFQMKRAAFSGSAGQPFYYKGASGTSVMNNVSQMGRDYWEFTHGTLPTEETVTVTPRIVGTSQASAGQNAATAAITVTVPFPTAVGGQSVDVGDTIVAVLAQRGSTSGWTVDAPSGWTDETHFDPIPRGANGRAWIQRHTVVSGDASSWTWTFANQIGQCNVLLFAVKGVLRLPSVETVYDSVAATSHTGASRRASVNGTVPVAVAITAGASGTTFTWSNATGVTSSTSATFSSAVQSLALGQMSSISAAASAAPAGSYATSQTCLMFTFMLEPSFD